MTDVRARLGRTLKSIRTQLGMTLADVSHRTGLPVSTLSKVENARLSLTYDNLVRLSEGLRIDINAFFERDPDTIDTLSHMVSARKTFTRAGFGTQVSTKNYDYRYLCTDLSRKAMVPILITIRARKLVEFKSLSTHLGEEFLYILRGPVEVHTEDYEPTILRTGDSMYLDSTMGHAFLTTGARSALMVNVCYSPHGGHFRSLLDMALERQRRDGEPFRRERGSDEQIREPT
jgi:transcriptional regulator with XRE-family HTH domain